MNETQINQSSPKKRSRSDEVQTRLHKFILISYFYGLAAGDVKVSNTIEADSYESALKEIIQKGNPEINFSLILSEKMVDFVVIDCKDDKVTCVMEKFDIDLNEADLDSANLELIEENTVTVRLGDFIDCYLNGEIDCEIPENDENDSLKYTVNKIHVTSGTSPPITSSSPSLKKCKK